MCISSSNSYSPIFVLEFAFLLPDLSSFPYSPHARHYVFPSVVHSFDSSSSFFHPPLLHLSSGYCIISHLLSFFPLPSLHVHFLSPLFTFLSPPFSLLSFLPFFFTSFPSFSPRSSSFPVYVPFLFPSNTFIFPPFNLRWVHPFHSFNASPLPPIPTLFFSPLSLRSFPLPSLNISVPIPSCVPFPSLLLSTFLDVLPRYSFFLFVHSVLARGFTMS